ncbi:hypothetical protein [Ralstonia phage phiRSL1]|uniref:Uncharacterized protein n=1 Tax=Ralstonia phage phiRSL1 TaxID=1980924 RepID=B2ZY87_9CAUD|nr:hypothetical protein RSL1_ORF275 [Ralstonia phage phiRSL1]BAG41722.1 hypothetical protein [Ralstonia phage phiRSL1]
MTFDDDGPSYEVSAENARRVLRNSGYHELEQFVSAKASQPSFQARVQPWMMECFGPAVSADVVERNHRFLEEALELVQACGCTASEAHQLVDYVFGRPVGEVYQEVGGVMVTLAALCLAQGRDMHQDGETELTRIWTKIEKIRAKQASKPNHSPLPEAVQDTVKVSVGQLLAEMLCGTHRREEPEYALFVLAYNNMPLAIRDQMADAVRHYLTQSLGADRVTD